jgi:hypothetical protein
VSQHYIDPNKVLTQETYERDIKRMQAMLDQQGQIVPLMVNPTDVPGFDFKADDNEYPMASALVIAARRLRWSTILVDDENVTSG